MTPPEVTGKDTAAPTEADATVESALPRLSRVPAFRRGPIRPATDKATVERIVEVRPWTEKLFSFRLSRPASFRFEPGQYARLGITGEAGSVIWRAYSMVSANYDEHLEFFSIVVPDGAFTTRLARLGVGDTLLLEKNAYGYLTTGRFVGGQDLWLLASGTGVAPFLSILRDPTVWARYDNIVLAYSVREARDLAYRDEIAALDRQEILADVGAHRGKLRFVPIVTRQQVPDTLGRRLTALIAGGELERFVDLRLDADRSRILICGNPQMLDDVRHVLMARGFRPDRSREPGHFATENYW